MTVFLLVAIIVFLFLLLAYSYVHLSRKGGLTDVFNSRLPMSPSEIYNTYYNRSDIDEKLVKELIEHVASELSIPAAKLRPSDRFDCELAAPKGLEWDSGHAILEIELLRLADEKGISVDAKSIVTLDDYIKLMARVY